MFTDGGKQNLQRDGFYRLGPMKVTQHMVYQVEIKFFFWEIEIKIKYRSQMGRWQEWPRAWGRSSQRDLDLKLSKVEYFFTTLVNNLMFAICRKETRRVGGLVGAGRGLQRHHVIAGGGRCCEGRKTLLVAQVHPWVSTNGVLLQVPKQDFQFKWLFGFIVLFQGLHQLLQGEKHRRQL